MSKSIVQFLATTQDVYDFIDKIRTEHQVTIMGAKRNTPNSYKVLLDSEKLNNTEYRFFHIKLGNHYEDINSLFICIGANDSESIRESVISIKGDGEEFDFWKKQIASFRKGLLKGAYVVNPYRNSKSYNKNIYYTVNAKRICENGVMMKPVAGWNYYLLDQE